MEINHIVYLSAAVKLVLEAVDQLAERTREAPTYPQHLLVSGEPGTGRRVVAQIFHQASARSGRLVTLTYPPVDYVAAATEMLGYAAGAFPEAVEDRPGALEAAADGTLVLDGIDECNNVLQNVLRNIIQRREFRRVSCLTLRPLRASIVAIMSEPAAGEVDSRLRDQIGSFIRLRPLRERPEDVGALAAYVGGLLKVGIDDNALLWLRYQYWPGNDRELMATIEKSAAHAKSRTTGSRDLITRSDLEWVAASRINIARSGEASEQGRIDFTFPTPAAATPYREMVRACETLLLKRALMDGGGNLKRAAQLYGVTQSLFEHKLHEHQIKHGEWRQPLTSEVAKESE